jgi:hypothetical protein
MTPKENAQEKVNDFAGKLITLEGQKKCALILVDEIIAASPPYNAKYWEEVKTEIELL